MPVLSQRYAAEDEDCRWVTLKAMDYIGGAEADALVKGAGLADKDGGPRRLAEKVTGGRSDQGARLPAIGLLGPVVGPAGAGSGRRAA